jgi:hypothetical protein
MRSNDSAGRFGFNGEVWPAQSATDAILDSLQGLSGPRVKQSSTRSKQRPCSLFCNGAKRLFVLFFIANSSDVYRQLRTSHQQNLVPRGIELA